MLAAHFLRGGHLVLVVLCLAALFVLTLRESWAARLMQVLLVLGSLEWIRTMAVLVSARRGLGEAWIRMAVILSSVALFTAASALVFLTLHLKKRYSLGARPGPEGGAP